MHENLNHRKLMTVVLLTPDSFAGGMCNFDSQHCDYDRLVLIVLQCCWKESAKIFCALF